MSKDNHASVSGIRRIGERVKVEAQEKEGKTGGRKQEDMREGGDKGGGGGASCGNVVL
jgi:hypothetical protein